MKVVVRYTLLVLLAFGVLAAALSAVPSNEWWIRWFDFPRVLSALILGSAFLGLLLFRPLKKWEVALAVAGMLGLTYEAYRIYPYLPLAAYDVPDAGDCAASLHVLTANVLMDNREAGELLAIIERLEPDVVFVVETDAWWADALNVLEENYPHRISEPLDNTYGLDLFSRLPLSNSQVRYLVEDDIPSVRTTVRLSTGQTVALYGVHPRPPRPESDTEQRDGELMTVAREISERGRPAIVVGDLNDVAWSATTRLVRDVGGLHDPRIGRGLFSSYHANIPVFRWPLDHIFTTEAFALQGLRVHAHIGSDHFPVSTRLCLTGEEDAPEPTGDESEEAQEVIDEAHEAERTDGPEED